MGSPRRQFTKAFKLAAVRRLEQGTSIAEAARALEVNPNVLHRRCRESIAWSLAELAGRRVGSLSWNGRLASSRWKSIFLKGCLQRIEEQRMLQALPGNPPSSRRSRKK